MWYYSKDGKEKKGPISDSAVSVLFSRGEITKSTMVWSPSQKKWSTLDKSDIYDKITSKKKSQHLIMLENYTRVFRAFLLSLFLFVLFMLSFYWNNLESYQNFLNNGGTIDRVSSVIQATENALTTRLTSLILTILCSATAFFGYKWVKTAITNTKMLAKRTAYSPRFSAWSFAIPIINLIIPKHILQEILSASLRSAKKKRVIRYVVLIFTWHIFWVTSIFMILISTFITPVNCAQDQFSPIYFSRILFFSTYAITILLSLAIVSATLKLQEKSLKYY